MRCGVAPTEGTCSEHTNSTTIDSHIKTRAVKTEEAWHALWFCNAFPQGQSKVAGVKGAPLKVTGR